MPDTTLQDALKEAYASVPTDRVVLDTLQIAHDDVATDIFIVNALKDLDAQLEGETATTTFSAVPFSFRLPVKDGQGVPELSVVIDNVKREASDYVQNVRTSSKPINLTYRPYLSNDLTQPQMDPPLNLQVRDVSINAFNVSFRATFFDFRNLRFPW